MLGEIYFEYFIAITFFPFCGQAKETPEPEFDLSECQLKDVPSGVFVMCRVLRKEKLLLNRNKLRTLNGGGLLGDLSLLQILDLRWNNLRKLPENLSVLQNLRVSSIWKIILYFRSLKMRITF